MKKRLKKKLKKNTFKIDDLVVFDDYIYSICWIDKAKQKSKSIYRLDGENFGIALTGNKRIKRFIPIQHSYKVGDTVTFYHQRTDSIYTEKITEIIDEASFRTENFISYFNYINVFKKRFKFNIGQTVYFGGKIFKITNFFMSSSGKVYVLNKNIFATEHQLKNYL